MMSECTALRRRRRACRRASAAATRASRISVSATTARTPERLDLGASVRVDGVDHERAAELAVRAGDADARDLDAERAHEPVGRTLHRRAADDRADADDPVAAGDEHVADARAPRGSARSRSPGWTGRRAIVSAVLERVEHPGRGPGRVGAVEAHRDDRRLGALAHEPLLHRELLGGAAVACGP